MCQGKRNGRLKIRKQVANRVPVPFDRTCVDRAGLDHQLNGVGQLVLATVRRVDAIQKIENIGLEDIPTQASEVGGRPRRFGLFPRGP